MPVRKGEVSHRNEVSACSGVIGYAEAAGQVETGVSLVFGPGVADASGP